MERTGIFGEENIHELKKKRLFLKDEIEMLRAKQAGLEE